MNFKDAEFRRGRAAILASFFFAGCAAFSGNRYEHATLPPPPGATTQRSVFVEMKILKGEGSSLDAFEIADSPVRPSARKAIERVLQRSGLFSSVTFDPFDQYTTDQALRMFFYLDDHPEATWLAGYAAIFTLWLFPHIGTNDYQLMAQTIPSDRRIKTSRYTNHDSVTLAMGWLMLPFSYATPLDVTEATFEGMVTDAVSRMIEAGEFNPPAPPVAQGAVSSETPDNRPSRPE